MKTQLRAMDGFNRHSGPMAKHFANAFGMGDDDTHIATVDADGVAPAAIQGLNEKLKVRSQGSEDITKKLESENADLKKEPANLKGMFERLSQPRKAY